LFDSLQVLLHFTYTSVQLRKGTIEYFRKCLEKQDAQAIISYQHELHEQSLIEMHNVSNQELYLEKMTKSTSIDLPLESRGLWGTFFVYIGYQIG
jgi:Na+-transporting NADH:ubiquinone oxidoreductase subunit NqrC